MLGASSSPNDPVAARCSDTMGAMPYGVVLLPDRRVHQRLAAVAAAIGGAESISLLGSEAPAHVSAAHFDGDAGQAAQARTWMARRPQWTMPVTIICLLYAVVAAGDYYVPQGGVYFGLEVVRRPDPSRSPARHRPGAWPPADPARR